MRSPFVVSLAVLASLVALVALAAPTPLFRAAPTWSLGGEGGWDYVTADAAARRLYVSHGTRVEVLDLRSRQKIGVIEPTPGVHGIALAPDLGRGFVSCGRDSSMVVFELATLHTLQRVALPARNPDAILYEPKTHRVFTFNGGSANATAIDAATTALLGTIDLGGKPEFAVADGAGKVFVNIEDKSQVVELDPKELVVRKRWSIAPGEEPSGLAMDRVHHRLFSVCDNRTMVISDADKGKVVGTLPIGGGVDGVVFDKRRELAISSNGEGTLTVVRAASRAAYAVAETDSTQRGARTVALDDSTGTLYLPTADFGPPPPPTPDRPHPRPSIVPDTFRLLIYRP
jgi:DNA-binding beta-propeller fold protein YncE